MQELTLKIKGMFTHPSDLGSVPEGALSKADDIVIDEEDIASPRRGFDILDSVFANYSLVFTDANVSVAVNSITSANHKLVNNDAIMLTSTGTLPAGLSAGGTYYVIEAGPNTFKLSTSRAGTAVDITAAAGGGDHTVTHARRARSLFFYKDQVMAYISANLFAYYNTSSGWTNLETGFKPPPGYTMRSVEAKQNLYVATSEGIKKFDNFGESSKSAGVPKALGITTTVNNPSITSAWIADDGAVAYRAVWGYRDANNNLIIGAVSQREEVVNTSGGNADISLRIEIPAGITPAHFVQVYRSAVVTTPAIPNDELGLVYEANPTASDISNGFLEVFQDITPDALRGATIYTAATQEGLANSNEQPPLARDIATYKGSTFYANTTSRHRVFLTLLASGGVNGLAINDTVVIDGVTYTAKLKETPGSAQFKVHGGSFTFVDADVSAADDTITETAHGLSNGDAVVLSTSGVLPAGLVAGTYYVVNATTDTFKLSLTSGGAAEDITGAAGGGTHTIVEGLGSPSQNIADTALSLVRVINQHNNSTVYAYYLSGADDLPGKIVLEERTFGGGGYAVFVSRATCWSPTGASNSFTFTSAFATDTLTASAHGMIDGTPVTVASSTTLPAGLSAATTYYVVNAATNTFKLAESLGGSPIDLTDNGTGTHTAYPGEASSNDRFMHGMSFSKTEEPEAVPLANFFPVGSANEEIQRIIPLRDSLFIFKEDGIYRLSGEDPTSFRVDLFDATTRLIAPDTAVVLNNQIFALTDQGVVAITEAGVQVKSRPIERTLTDILGLNQAVLKQESFGVAYETDRKYILFVPTQAGDVGPSQAFVYNTFTNTWTRWVLSKTCGGVNPADDRVYLGDASSAYVNQERKTFSFSDHADYKSTVEITDVSGTVVTVSSGVERVSPGDIIYESATVFATVESVDVVANQITINITTAFTNGTRIVYGSIPTKVAWVPNTGKNPGSLKQFREVTMIFRELFQGRATVAFTSDQSQSEETEILDGGSIGSWGLFAWGDALWGGIANRKPPRIIVPRNKQRATLLTVEFRHSRGFTKYRLNGFSLIENIVSERVGY